MLDKKMRTETIMKNRMKSIANGVSSFELRSEAAVFIPSLLLSAPPKSIQRSKVMEKDTIKISKQLKILRNTSIDQDHKSRYLCTPLESLHISKVTPQKS